MRSFFNRSQRGNALFQNTIAFRTQCQWLLTICVAFELALAITALTGCGTLGAKQAPQHPASNGSMRIAAADSVTPDATSWNLSDSTAPVTKADDRQLKNAADAEQFGSQPARVEQNPGEQAVPAVASVSYETPLISSPSDEVYGSRSDYVTGGNGAESFEVPISAPQVSFDNVECATSAPMCSSCGNDCGNQCSSSGVAYMTPAEPQRKNSNEYIFDGGDQEPSVVVKKDWTAAGVDPTDTVIYYETLGGQVCVKPSNRVPIYAPRFGAVRQVTGITLAARAVGTERMLAPISPSNFRETDLAGNVTAPIAPHGEQQVGMLDAFQENRLGVPMAQVIPPAGMSETLVMFEDISFFATGEMIYDEVPVLGRVLANAREWYTPESVEVVIDGQQAALVVDAKRAQDVHVYEMPDKCAMRICKAASHTIANSGDIVRFTIRFDNVGPKPLGNAVVMDSLSARLEYIEGSQQCSVDAKFSADANDVGSQVLRWEIEEAINPSNGGVISFDCRVR